MPFVLPHQGRKEGERAAAGVREGEKGRWREREERRGGQERRGEGGVFNYQTAYSMLEYRRVGCIQLLE